MTEPTIVHVPLGERAYDIVIGPGLLETAGDRLITETDFSHERRERRLVTAGNLPGAGWNALPACKRRHALRAVATRIEADRQHLIHPVVNYRAH